MRAVVVRYSRRVGCEWARRGERSLDRLDHGDTDQISSRRLRVGAVDDPAEVRADRLASRALASLSASNPSIMRSSSGPAGDAGRVRRSALASLPGGLGAEGGELDQSTSDRLAGPGGGGGHPLEPTLRSSMEGAFGVSLDRVRVHDDRSSAHLARSMNAEAFTLGRHVYFASGAYAPQRRHGVETIAHELGHVVDGGAAGTVARRVIRRRFSYKLSDVDQVAPKKSRIRIPLKKDPLAPLRKVLKGYEKVPTSVDELWWINQIQQAADGFLSAVAGDPKYAAASRVVEDISFAARAESGKLHAKAIYLRDAKAGAALQGYDPRNPYAKSPETPVGASPLKHQFMGAKQVVTDPAQALAKGTTSGSSGNDGASDTSRALMMKYGLDAADVAAIRAYSNDDFKYINPAVENQAWSSGQLDDLVNGDARIAAQKASGKEDASGGHWHEDDPAKRAAKVAEMQQEGRLQAGMLLGALQKTEPKQLMVYRGMSLSESELRTRFNGSVTWGSFTSTTVSTAVATKFADGAETPYDRKVKDLHTTLVIDACEAYDLQDFSVQGDKEGEYLLLPGAALRVVGIDRQATPFPETTAETVKGRRDGVREYVRIRLTQLPSPATSPKNSTRAANPRAQRSARSAAPGAAGGESPSSGAAVSGTRAQRTRR